LVETASFLAIVTFLRRRGAVGFMARSVAQHFEDQGTVRVLKLPVPVELPAIGMITLRARPLTTTTQQLMDCLRQAAREASAAPSAPSPGSAAPRRRSTPARRSRAG
jgi:DNA-binding transcriptional LysR family regulator